MRKVSLTIGHKVGPIEVHDTASICREVTTTLGVSAFTAIPCYGMWEGQAELSTRIELVVDDDKARDIISLVPYLAWKLNQEAIMCEDVDASVTFPAATIPAIA